MMKHAWRQWLGKFLVRGTKSTGNRRPRVHPTLEILEDRTLPSGGVPFVQSIDRGVPTGPTTNATSVSYAVTFNEAVTGVVASDFMVTTDGSTQATTPVAVSGNGSAYTVAVNGIHGSGDLRLDLIDDGSIQAGGIPLGSPGGSNGSFQGQTYNILQTYPSVVSINRANANPTNATTVSFTVTFSEPVTGVDPTDFQLATTGSVGSTLTQVTPVSGSVYTVTVSGITGNGTLGLNLVDDGTIHDLVGNPLTQLNSPVEFQQTPAYAVGQSPSSVALGDINRDGKLDLAVANFGDNSVSILLGNGDGTFQNQTTVAAGAYPTSVVLADLTGDGNPDLIVANEGSPGAVSVLLGNGNGTFQSDNSFATGSGSMFMAVADVNGDGKPDLAVVNKSDNTVSVLLGNGNGTFQAQQVFPTGPFPVSVALADLTGNGKPDLAVANSGGESVSVLLGNGNGTFQAQQTFGTGAALSVAIGDLNGDGKPDLAVPNGKSNTVSVLLGNGNGTFQAQQTFGTGAFPESVTIGDLNGDGKADLAVADYRSNAVSVLLGNGNGTFQTQHAFVTSELGAFSVALGDLTGDGKPDLVVVNRGSYTVSVLLSNGDGTLQAQQAIATGPYSFSVAEGDVNGDGKPDLAVTCYDFFTKQSFVAIMLGNGNGTFQAQQTFATGSNPQSVVLGDVNGDGKPDLLVANAYSGTVSVLLGNGDGTFQAQQTFAPEGSPFSVVVADVNGDGKPDLAVANRYDGTVGVLLGNGNGTFQAPPTFATGRIFSLTMGDVNGDGIPDVVVPSWFGTTVSVLLGNGNGTFQAQRTFATGLWPRQVAIGDVTGDGIPDLLVACGNRYGEVSVLLGNGNGTFQAQRTFAAGAYPHSIALGDLNGDGKLDLAVANSDGDTVNVLMGNGNGTFQAQQLWATGASPYSVVISDLNGDGRPDLALANRYSNTVSVLLNAANGDFTGQVYTIDTIAPFVQSIDRSVPTGPTTDATSVSYAVTFNEAVTGVAAGDFQVTTDGVTQAASQVAVSGSGANYTVTVSGIHGSGDLRLDLIDNGTINSGGIPLSGPGGGNDSFQGQTYNILQTYPSVVSINRADASPTNATTVSFTVTFSEPVTGVDPTDFQLATTGTVGSTLTQVTPVSGSVYTVTVSGITGNGTLGLNLVDNGTIRDLAGNPLTQQNAPAAFQAQQTFATGPGPNSVALGDVDGDGKPDLVTVNYAHGNTNTVSVLLGNGNGTFQAQLTFATGVSPRSVALSDVNGDGKPDLAVANFGSTTVSVLLGNGNGTFQAQQTFATGFGPDSVVLGDVTGDGKPDLAVANEFSGTVSVLLGNGNGTFQAQQAFATGAQPREVALGDLTGDGKSDLAVANYGSNTVSVLLGNGNGTFQAQQTFVTGSSPISVAVGDFNGDGVPDLAVANHIYQNGTVSVLLGNGNGTFQARQSFATGSDPRSVVVGDFNGDGKPDLVVANEGGTVSVLLGNGNGTFQAQQTFATGSLPISVALGDVNGDGRPDLAVANYLSNTVSVLLGNGNGNFTGQVYTLFSSPATHFVVSAAPTTTAGNAFAFTVTAEDQSNNTATGYSGTVHFASSDNQAVLPANATLTNGAGTFSATLATAGSQTLTAKDTVATTITGSSSPITVSAAAATHFVFSTTPTSIAAGTAFRFTVTARDQFNNTATSYTGIVDLSSSDSAASFVPSSDTLTNGVGVFSVTLRTAGSQTLIAADSLSAGIAGTSNTIGVRPLAATHLVLGGIPTSSTAGVAFSFTVTAEDMFDNIATGYTGTVTMLSTDNGAVFVPAKSALTSGVGTFTATLETAGGQTLTATDFGGSSLTGTSLPFLVHAGPATHLVTTATPHSLTAGTPFSITVTALDSFNNTAIGYTGTVALASTDPAAALTPASSTLASGVGTFSVTLETAGFQTLTVKDAVAATITGSSNTIAVLTGAPSHFLINGVPSTISAGTALRFTVTAQDAFNNAATSYTGTVAISTSDSAASLPRASTLTSGVGVFSATLVTAGDRTLTAADTATPSLNGNAAITVLALAATHFLVSAPAIVRPNHILSYTVTALDQYGNIATAYAGTVNLTSSDGQAVLDGPSTLNSGVGVFAAVFGTEGNQTLGATDMATPTITASATVAVTSPATHFVVVTSTSSTTAGNPFVIVAIAENQFNNTDAGYTGVVHFTSSESQAGLPADGTLNSGIGFFAAILKTAGSQTITVTDTVSANITGASNNIAVRAAAATHFVVATALPTFAGVLSGPNQFATTGIPVNFTVTAQDPFGNTATTYSSTLHFTSSDTAPGVVLPPGSTLTSGMGTFSATLRTPGTQTLAVTDGTSTGTSSPFAARGLVVTSFTTTPTGFTVTFNKPFQTSTVNLYTTGTLPDDVLLATTGTQDSVRGSVLFNSPTSPTSMTFVKTTMVSALGTFNPGNGLLAAGNYTVTLRSFSAGGSGFQDALGSLLDGNNSGNPGANFVFTFSVSTPPVAVGIPDFARGPSNTDAIAITGALTLLTLPAAEILVTGQPLITVNGGVFPLALASQGFYMKAIAQTATSITLVLDVDYVQGAVFDADITILVQQMPDGSVQVSCLAREDVGHVFTLLGPSGQVLISDFNPGDAPYVFPPSGATVQDGGTFGLSYTNPAATPVTGTATITFSNTAATLLNNIQNALNALPQIGFSGGNVPNAAVVVINDSPTAGANVLVTFQSALAQATNQLLISTTPGVSISLATINAANNLPSNGIPIALSSGLNVTSGSFTLQYNPTLLNITGAVSNIAGASFTLNTTINNATSATAVLSLSSPSTISSTATAITIGSLLATVPLSATASYGAKQLLHFSSEQLNGTAGPIAVTNQDGVQVAAYLGDVADKGGAFSLQDATAISAVAGGIASTVAQTIPGFATFPNLDPAIIGDVSLAGAVNFADASLMNQQLVSAQVKIPYAPIGLPVTPVGPDPTLSVPTDLVASPGGTVIVPVNIDTARPPGSTGMVQAVLALSYDPKVFDVSAAEVQLGTVPEDGSGWKMQTEVNAQAGLIGIELFSTTPIQSTAGGSLVTIAMHLRGEPGPSVPDLTIVPYVDPSGGPSVYQTSLLGAEGEFVWHTAADGGQSTMNSGTTPDCSQATASTLPSPVPDHAAAIEHRTSNIGPTTLPLAVVEQVFADLAQTASYCLESSDQGPNAVPDLALMWLDTNGLLESSLVELGFKKIAGEAPIFRHSVLRTLFSDRHPQGQDADVEALPEYEE